MSIVYSMPGHLIRRLQQISASVFADQMREHGFDLTSPQFAALTVLDKHPGVDQATLAGLIAHDRPTIGGVVDRLAKKGLVKRKSNPADGRAKLVHLTPHGVDVLARVLPIVLEMQVTILPGLTADERTEFTRLASIVAKAGNDLSRAPLLPVARKCAAKTATD
ncbi:MAG TPA: MarR family transcriptional regulator [Kiloniellaceae bacterium]|nr:MarR family transcriptional regulator [Kiloniellaceae bacterium]